MDKKPRKLLEQIKKRNYINYPINNALLADETDYIKNNYFRHLALMLTQGDGTTENQRYLFSRMLEGVKVEDTIEGYLRQALDIDIDQYVEFIDQLKERELRYRFLLDAILITCCDVHTEEQEELLACFMESLKISLTETRSICKISRSILEQDKESYWELMMSIEGLSFQNFAEDHSVDFAGRYLDIESDGLIHLYFPVKEEVTREMLHLKNGERVLNGYKEVKIQNAIFDMSGEDLSIKDCEKVKIINCEFRGGSYEIALTMDSKVEFINCRFTDFKKCAIKIDCEQEASIRFYQCYFEKCYMESNRDCFSGETSGVIFSEKNSTIYIDTSLFKDCGIVENFFIHSSDKIILNKKATVTNCHFENCWGYSYATMPEKKNIDFSVSMFTSKSINEGNSIIDSAPFTK